MIPTLVATRSTRFGAPAVTTKHVDASSRYATIPTTGYVGQFKMRWNASSAPIATLAREAAETTKVAASGPATSPSRLRVG